MKNMSTKGEVMSRNNEQVSSVGRLGLYCDKRCNAVCVSVARFCSQQGANGAELGSQLPWRRFVVSGSVTAVIVVCVSNRLLNFTEF